MEVIPVIDLKAGAVVRAFRGQRETYRPIVTPLAPGSAPEDVVAGFLALHPFRTIYVADLDAIEARGAQDGAIARLRRAFPAVSFWVDPGVRGLADARSWLSRHGEAHLVLGSESLQDFAPIESLPDRGRLVLSLDYRGDTLLGPKGLFDAVSIWPERVIVMTLARIGTHFGPDLDRLAIIARNAPGHRIFAAGGLRGAHDFEPLAKAGLSGVLVASALHEGRLTGADLAAAAQGTEH